MEATPDRDPPDPHAPRRIRLCREPDDDHLTQVLRMSRGELRDIHMLHAFLESQDVLILPFTGLLPGRTADSVVGAVTAARVQRKVRPADRVPGPLCELGAFYTHPAADADSLKVRMLGDVKRLLGEIRCRALRALVGLEESDAQEQMEWFMHQGFSAVMSPRRRGYVLTWEPEFPAGKERRSAS